MAIESLAINQQNSQVEDEGGWAAVASDLYQGAANELVEHPLNLVKSFALGTGTAIAIGAVSVAAAAFLPEIAVTGALVVGAAALAGYELSQYAPEWWNDISVVANAEEHTPEEVAQSHSDLKELGADTLDFAAGLLGGGLTSGYLKPHLMPKPTYILDQGADGVFNLAVKYPASSYYARPQDPLVPIIGNSLYELIDEK